MIRTKTILGAAILALLLIAAACGSQRQETSPKPGIPSQRETAAGSGGAQAETPDSLLRNAEAAYQAGKWEEVLQLIETIRKDYAGSPAAKKAEQLEMNVRASQVMEQAKEAARAENWEEAVALLDRILTEYPGAEAAEEAAACREEGNRNMGFRGTVRLVINDSKTDTDSQVRTFLKDYMISAEMQIHILVEQETDEEVPIRILTESQWGTDGTTEADFSIESDEIKTVRSNRWYTENLNDTSSNLYFWRITVYYGETSQILATRTVYTPFKGKVYSEDSIRDDQPEFHPYAELTEEEQYCLDLIKPAILDYGRKNHYACLAGSTISQNRIGASKKGTTVYTSVSYAANKDKKKLTEVYFAIL